MGKNRTARDLAGCLRHWIANPDHDNLDGLHSPADDLQNEWLLESAAEVAYVGEPGRNFARLTVSTDAGVFTVTIQRGSPKQSLSDLIPDSGDH